MAYFLLLLLAAWQTTGEDRNQTEVLSRATRKVLATNARIPNYTCVQTITRRYFHTAANNLPRPCQSIMEIRKHPTLDMVLHHFGTDRLRLEVAMVEGGEIFSWVGANRFDDRELGHLVRDGPLGTGMFNGVLRVLFQNDVKSFNFLGSRSDPTTLYQYSYEVPQDTSHMRVKVGSSWAMTAYQGTMLVDPASGDLVNITLDTAELPTAAGECASMLSMDVRMTEIGSRQVYLPTAARQRFVAPDGKEVENTIEFSNCREYVGESKLIFGEPAEAAGRRPASIPPPPTTVPPGSRFSFELTQAIDSDEAAVGDPFAARLSQPLRDSGLRVLVPKGSVVTGHVVRMESFKSPPQVVIALRPEALEIHGAQVPLTAVPDYSQSQLRARNNKDRRRLEFTLPRAGEEHAGLFRFAGEHAVVPKGFQSDWRTVARQPD